MAWIPFPTYCPFVRKIHRTDGAMNYQRCPNYSDVIMSTMTVQITGVSSVCSTLCSGADQSEHQSSAPLAFVRGIHPSPVDSPQRGPVMRKHVSISWRHHVFQNHETPANNVYIGTGSGRTIQNLLSHSGLKCQPWTVCTQLCSITARSRVENRHPIRQIIQIWKQTIICDAHENVNLERLLIKIVSFILFCRLLGGIRITFISAVARVADIIHHWGLKPF